MMNPTEKQAPKLLDQVRDRIRVKHYSQRTDGAFLSYTHADYDKLCKK